MSLWDSLHMLYALVSVPYKARYASVRKPSWTSSLLLEITCLEHFTQPSVSARTSGGAWQILLVVTGFLPPLKGARIVIQSVGTFRILVGLGLGATQWTRWKLPAIWESSRLMGKSMTLGRSSHQYV